MSILIKGIKMPKSCEECRFCDNDAMCVILGEDLFDHVQAEGTEHIRYLPDNWKWDACHLVEIPPRGRLIDADKMTDEELAQLLVYSPWFREEAALKWLKKERAETNKAKRIHRNEVK